MAFRALRSNRLKVGISQHEPFAAGLFKLHLHPGVLALACDPDHGAKPELFMVYGGAKAQRRGRAAVGLLVYWAILGLCFFLFVFTKTTRFVFLVSNQDRITKLWSLRSWMK